MSIKIRMADFSSKLVNRYEVSEFQEKYFSFINQNWWDRKEILELDFTGIEKVSREFIYELFLDFAKYDGCVHEFNKRIKIINADKFIKIIQYEISEIFPNAEECEDFETEYESIFSYPKRTRYLAIFVLIIFFLYCIISSIYFPEHMNFIKKWYSPFLVMWVMVYIRITNNFI